MDDYSAIEQPAFESLTTEGNPLDDPLVAIDLELIEDAARRLEYAIAQMNRFLARDEVQCLGGDDPTKVLCAALNHEARQLLENGLRRGGSAQECTLRSAYRLAGALANLVAWSAPASRESAAVNSFPLAAARDVVSYARYGGPETIAQEAVYAAMLGFDSTRTRLLLTSSGMAAYALIESFLLREVLRPADKVVLSPGVYFETRHQVESLAFLDVRIAPGGGASELIEAIEECQPRVVFVDPLTNSAELRVIDLSRLLAVAERVCEREVWFVIDGTLLSGSFDLFASQSGQRKVRILYYESGCKYLQFGMDLGPAGVVVVAADLAARFEQLRRGMGAIAAESLVLPRASREAYVGYLQAQTTAARAVARAVRQASADGARVVECAFPSEPQHCDHLEARRYRHLGGLLVFRFIDDRRNRRKPLERFIDRLIAMAQRQCLPLTAGVSFGFRTPRIGAAWASYDADEAFLRLSAGVRPDVASELGRLIVQCAREFEPDGGGDAGY
jgi:cystathionine gamma-synthase